MLSVHRPPKPSPRPAHRGCGRVGLCSPAGGSGPLLAGPQPLGARVRDTGGSDSFLPCCLQPTHPPFVIGNACGHKQLGPSGECEGGLLATQRREAPNGTAWGLVWWKPAHEQLSRGHPEWARGGFRTATLGSCHKEEMFLSLKTHAQWDPWKACCFGGPVS